jgi:hypothetical protein
MSWCDFIHSAQRTEILRRHGTNATIHGQTWKSSHRSDGCSTSLSAKYMCFFGTFSFSQAMEIHIIIFKSLSTALAKNYRTIVGAFSTLIRIHRRFTNKFLTK